jgi:hypothetical protein
VLRSYMERTGTSAPKRSMKRGRVEHAVAADERADHHTVI